MARELDLDTAYEEAQEAIAARDYDRASSLLQRIVVVDETYKDAARLLSTIVSRQRRRWYQQPALWAVIGGICLVAVGIFIGANLPAWLPPSTTEPQATATIPIATPTATPTPTPRYTQYRWQRQSTSDSLSPASVFTIAIDPDDPDIWYVGTENAGLYRSVDGGLSWAPIQNGAQSAATLTLVVDPEDSSTIYAGSLFAGLARTSDRGDHWQAITAGDDAPACPGAVMAMDPQNPQHLYYTTGYCDELERDASGSVGELYETMDGGESWTLAHKYPCPRVLWDLEVSPAGGDVLIGLQAWDTYQCGAGMYKSDNGGETWAFTDPAEDIPGEVLLDHAIDGQSGAYVYVHGASGRLFGSTDGGDSWNVIADGVCGAFTIDPDDGRTVYCAGPDSVMMTADAGSNWQQIGVFQGLGGTDPIAIALSPHDPNTFFVAALGLYVSSDGGSTWALRNGGIGSTILELAIDPEDPAALYLEDYGSGSLQRSYDRGATWELVSDAGERIAFGAGDDTLYRCQGRSGTLVSVRKGYPCGEAEFLRSSDAGLTWDTLPLPTDSPMLLTAHPSRPRTLFSVIHHLAEGSHIFRSEDGGGSWEAASVSRPADYASGACTAVVFDHDDGDTGYAISYGGEGYRTDDAGLNWRSCEYTPSRNSTSPSSAAIDPLDPEHVVVASLGNGVVVSEDGGASWSTSTAGLGSLAVNGVAFDPTNPETIYAATQGGAYVSFDGGETWGPINEGLLGGLVIYSIVVDAEGNVYAATPLGVFTLESQ
jgi:photosystem II stability/assembly factor-like uncharacterized protein